MRAKAWEESDLWRKYSPVFDVKNHIYKTTEMLYNHIEMMAAAYLRRTDIDPRRVELVQVSEENGRVMRFYFRERETGAVCPRCGERKK